MTDRPAEPKPVEEMTFEEAIRELEAVVHRLERGEVALEESIALYERGTRLRERCESKLKDAEAKIEKITLDGSGEPRGTEPLDAG